MNLESPWWPPRARLRSRLWGSELGSTAPPLLIDIGFEKGSLPLIGTAPKAAKRLRSAQPYTATADLDLISGGGWAPTSNGRRPLPEIALMPRLKQCGKQQLPRATAF
jgi:hypothetical protein